MSVKSSIALSFVAGAVIVGAGYWFTLHKGGATAHPIEAVVSTPPGVTFQWVKVGKVTQIAGASSDQQALQTVYADSKGMTLYTYDKDTRPGKSACLGDCAKRWPPLAAADDAKPVGNWSIITRDDGSKQWALKGKPLYTFADDALIGDYKGQNIEQVWHMASLEPAKGMALPDGIAVQEVAEASGQVLVDSRGMPLYALDGDAAAGKPQCTAGPCGSQWQPLLAGQLVNPIGDFTIIDRADGIQQWAYKGHALFTYTGDIELGDANGKDADGKLHLAMIEHYFMPQGVTIIPNEKKGGLLVTVDGKTLYARDRISFNGTGSHGARGGDRGKPTVGMAIGASGCDADCTRQWHPLTAPADAKPSGYWSLAKRDDGTQQWAYQGYALYTYDGDKQPGDTSGQDIYDLAVNDGPKVTDARFGLGLYWRTTAP